MKRGILNLRCPIDHGIIQYYDDMEKINYQIFPIILILTYYRYGIIFSTMNFMKTTQ